MATTRAGRGSRIWISVGLCLLAFLGFAAAIVPVGSSTVAPVIGLILIFVLLRILLISTAEAPDIRRVVLLIAVIAALVGLTTLILITQTSRLPLGLGGSVVAMIMMAALAVLWLLDRRPAPDATRQR